jgi:hypothetical protein
VSTDWIGNIFSRWFSFWGRGGYENREKMRRSACRFRREKTTMTEPAEPLQAKEKHKLIQSILVVQCSEQ